MIFVHDTPTNRLLNMVLGGGSPIAEYTETGNPVSFITDVSKPLKSLLILFTPQQSGTGDPSPQNIRSILPWDGLKVWNGGKNLIDINTFARSSESYSVTVSNGIATGTATSFSRLYQNDDMVKLPNALCSSRLTMTVSAYTDGNASTAEVEGLIIRIKYTDNSVSERSWNNSDLTAKQKKITTTQGKTIAGITFAYNSGGSNIWHISELQLELGESASTYEAPHITETDIVFPSPVYGGTLDVVSGVLTVEWALLSKAWKDWNFGADLGTNSRKTADLIPYGRNGSANSICNVSDYYFNNNSTDVVHWYISTTGRTAYAVLPNDMDEDTFVEIAYKLATPQEIQLTPEQITAIVGDNTIWSDADGSMTAVYLKKG